MDADGNHHGRSGPLLPFTCRGAVAQENQARLLIGPSDPGKTSLALTLAMRGAAIFTDEVTLLEPEGLQVVPFRRDLIFHQDSQYLITRIGQNGPRFAFQRL